MSYVLIALYGLAALLLFGSGLSFQKSNRSKASATLPSAERTYWADLNKKVVKSFYIGASGAAITAVSIALLQALLAEIGCITLMAAMVFSLAVHCRKTNFTPSTETERLQKRRKILFLVASFTALFMTQWVFQFFNMK
jgi:hypothetical protein